MLYLQKQVSRISYCVTLLICCCSIVSSGIAYGQELKNVDTVQETDDTDRVFDFEVGQIESLSKEMITVNDQQFLLTEDTQFNNSDGSPLNDTNDISEGIEVAISFYPYEDTAIAVELLPDENENAPLKKKTSSKAAKPKKKVITFKNGVYSN